MFTRLLYYFYFLLLFNYKYIYIYMCMCVCVCVCVFYTSHTPTKNKIKENEPQWMNETHFFIKMYLSHSILERGTQFVVSLWDRWRDILREGTSSCPISSSWSQGMPTLAPACKPYRQRRPNASDRLRIPGSTLDSDWPDCLNSDRVVKHLLVRPTPTHCHPPVY